MELTKTKFKQTEVGLIPEDWVVDKFKELTDIITCGVAATPKYVSSNNGMPFLSASHVQEGRVIPNNYKFITKELYYQITNNNKPQRGDLLYTRVGAGIGEAGVIEFDLDFAIYVSLTLIRPTRKINNYYLKFLLNSNFYKNLAKNGQFAGAGVQNLNVEVVRNFPIPVPPLREQKAIAQVLNDTDSLIQTLEQKLAKKRAIKQGIMQQLLTPKEDWDVRKLGEILQFGNGKDYKHLKPGLIPVYGTGGIMTFVNNYLFDGNSVGIGRKGTIDKPIFLKGKFWTVDTLFFTHSFKESNPKYIYYQFGLIKWKDYNEASGVPSLSKKTLEEIEIRIPSIQEQTRIATILSDMDMEIAQLEQKLEKYKLLKQGLMQELLTGKIRLI